MFKILRLAKDGGVYLKASEKKNVRQVAQPEIDHEATGKVDQNADSRYEAFDHTGQKLSPEISQILAEVGISPRRG